MLVQRAEYAVATMIPVNVDTLNPPHLTIAPVAPFIGDRGLSNDLSVDFRDKVNSTFRFGQEICDTTHDCISIQILVLGFAAQRDVELADDGCVGLVRISNG